MEKWFLPKGLKIKLEVGPKKLKEGVFTVSQRCKTEESDAITRSNLSIKLSVICCV